MTRSRRGRAAPLRDSLAELLATRNADTLDVALAHYRERYAAIGWSENTVYPFVLPALQRLRADGHRMWIATSKPSPYAERIAEHFALAEYFECVYGSELSGARSDKAQLVAYILETERLEPSDTWMVGDRSHDIVGGAANGTRTVGALWGYGSPQELIAAGADILIDQLDALRSHLAPLPNES